MIEQSTKGLNAWRPSFVRDSVRIDGMRLDSPDKSRLVAIASRRYSSVMSAGT
jgi:hypothetical protein